MTKTSTFGLTFDVTGTPTFGDLGAMAESAAQGVLSDMGLFSTAIGFGQCHAFGFERAGAGTEADPFHREAITPVAVSTTSPGAGTAAGPALPANCAFVISFSTAVAGRSGIGRCYTPAPPEAVVADNGIVSDAGDRRDWVQQIAANVEASLTPTDVDHVVYSLLLNSTQEVTTYTGRSRIDTQRRRLQRLPG